MGENKIFRFLIVGLLVSCCSLSTAKTADLQGAECVSSFTVTRSTTSSIDLRAYRGVRNKWVRLENVGTTSVVAPWVVVNDRRDWFDSKRITADAVGDEKDPEKRAFRIWRFVMEHSFHWYPPHDRLSLHDPVRFFNTYGYGFCDDAAQIVCALAQVAGFEKERIQFLTVHFVSEIFYNKDWHLFDSDMHAFFPPKKTNRGALGLAAMLKDFGLMRRVRPDFESIYRNKTEPGNVQGWRTATNMAMTLRPGESVMRYFDNNGKFLHKTGFYPRNENIIPPRYGYGTQVYPSPDELSIGVDESPTSKVLSLSMQTPYVYLDGSVEMDVELDPRTRMEIRGTSAYAKGVLLDSISGPFSGPCRIPLRPRLLNHQDGREKNVLALDVALVKDTNSGTSATVSNIVCTGEFQCAPHALPRLVGGQLNTVRTTLSSDEDTSLSVAFGFEKDDDAVVLRPVKPLYPQDGEVITTDAPVLRWQSTYDVETTVCRQLIVSWDEAGVLPVAPNTMSLDNVSPLPEFAIPSGWLLPKQTYYWRVREVPAGQDAEDLPWCGPWSFRVGALKK